MGPLTENLSLPVACYLNVAPRFETSVSVNISSGHFESAVDRILCSAVADKINPSKCSYQLICGPKVSLWLIILVYFEVLQIYSTIKWDLLCMSSILLGKRGALALISGSWFSKFVFLFTFMGAIGLWLFSSAALVFWYGIELILQENYSGGAVVTVGRYLIFCIFKYYYIFCPVVLIIQLFFSVIANKLANFREADGHLQLTRNAVGAWPCALMSNICKNPSSWTALYKTWKLIFCSSKTAVCITRLVLTGKLRNFISIKTVESELKTKWPVVILEVNCRKPRLLNVIISVYFQSSLLILFLFKYLHGIEPIFRRYNTSGYGGTFFQAAV